MGLYDSILTDAIKSFHRIFNEHCINRGIAYRIIEDKEDKQVYLVSSKDILYLELLNQLKESSKPINVEISAVDDGTIVIVEETNEGIGHWQVKGAPYAMPGQPKTAKRSDYSPLSRKSDVKKVRAGKMPIQKYGNIEAKKATFGTKKEDQYKLPTGKHRRSQSMFPSSFSKSKTFGGISDDMKGKPKVALPNLKPIGLFGPVDKGSPSGTPPTGTGEIRTGGSAKIAGEYGERTRTWGAPSRPGVGGRGVRRGGGGTRAESFLDRLDSVLYESYAEDDVYTIVQRIAIDSGLTSTSKPRKYQYPGSAHLAKVCNGRVSVEAKPWRRYILVEVYKDDKKIYNSELDVRIGGPLRNEKAIKEIIDVVKKAME